MNANLAVGPEALSDASIVKLSLTGDREAFGQIVARYQSPICALAYSARGSVARSEDLAQEIFITAWRNLGSLQDPARFKAWLYGIARNLIHNDFRQHHRNPAAGAGSLEDAAETASLIDKPDEQAINKEEETILWRVLSGLPEIYREPMVLFYRQYESIPQVADVLGISEVAVRQRLSRGRALLNERVTKVIQNGLRRMRPADTFAVTVIAAAGLLVFCYLDTHHNVVHLSPDEIHDIINASNPGELRISISVCGESPNVYRYFLMIVRRDGKTTTYSSPVEESIMALLAQKGIACPTHIRGRDFEVLGTPGRCLPLLCAFVLAIGAIFLLKRPRIASSVVN